MSDSSFTKTVEATAVHDLTMRVFVWLFGVHLVCEQAKWDDWAKSPLDGAMTVLAWLVVLLPGKLNVFVLLAVVQVASAANRMPWISNHSLLGMLILVTFLAAAAHVRTAHRGPMDWARVYDSFAPCGRALMVVFYAWAGFHKLNSEFLDTTYSCAIVQYLEWTDMVTFLPTGRPALIGVIIVTLVLELSVAPLLLFRRTRVIGIIVACAMHWLFGLAGFYRFGSLAFACLFLFVPDDVMSQAKELVTRSAPWRMVDAILCSVMWRRLYILGVTMFMVAAVSVVLWKLKWAGRSSAYPIFRPMTGHDRSTMSHLFQFAWMCFALLLVITLIVSWRRALRAGRLHCEGAWSMVRPRPWWLAVIPIVALINGASPYLGLKTETAFAMFSNLRTEDGRSNHLIVRSPLYLAEYQSDLVTVVSSSNKVLSDVADSGYRLTWFEFRSFVHQQAARSDEPLAVVYERGGQTMDVPDARLDETLDQPDSFLLRKMLYFRAVAPPGEGSCMH